MCRTGRDGLRSFAKPSQEPPEGPAGLALAREGRKTISGPKILAMDAREQKDDYLRDGASSQGTPTGRAAQAGPARNPPEL